MSEEGMPTYVAGDIIRVCVEVKPRTTRKGICRVYATFVHEADPTKEIELSDDPESRSYAQVQTEDDVELRGLVVAGAHPTGEYRLKKMAAEYPGGRTVRFADPPDVAFRVVEEEIRSPRSPGGGGSSSEPGTPGPRQSSRSLVGPDTPAYQLHELTTT